MAYFFIVYKNKNVQTDKEKKDTKKTSETFNGIPKEEINKLLDFDEIKDDMIIRKDGQQYIMAIQCKGINYDLLSVEVI